MMTIRALMQFVVAASLLFFALVAGAAEVIRFGYLELNKDPRYDEKTGKDLLEGTKDIRLALSGSISQATLGKGDTTWVWDVTKDNPDALGTGKAIDRLELDRLLRRMEKLTEERGELQKKLEVIDKELVEVSGRVDELQTR